jgi:glutamate/aspartate transport system substrate-binding protein
MATDSRTPGARVSRRIARVAAAVGAALLACAGPADAQTGTLQKVKDTGTLVIGYRENSKPFSFLEGGKPVGYSIDLCHRIAEAVKEELKLRALKIRYVPVTVQTRIEAVAKGLVDIECGSTTATLSRLEKVDFTLPTFVDGGSLLATERSQVQVTGDLAGKRVAVIAGTTTQRALAAALKEGGVNATVVDVKDHDGGLAALESGAADAYASDRVLLLSLMLSAKSPSSLVLSDQLYSYEPYAFMIRRDDSAFRLVANRALARLYRSPAAGELFRKWFAAMGKPTPALVLMFLMNGLPE